MPMPAIIDTGVIQSSAATTVMVMGFVNAGLMTLFQATAIIMGANVGTTVTGIMPRSKPSDINFMPNIKMPMPAIIDNTLYTTFKQRQ